MRILNSTLSTFKLSRQLRLAILAIIALASLFLLYGTPKRKVAAQGRQKFDHRTRAPKPTRTSQTMYAPITAMEQSSGSELALNNNGPISIAVTPVFYSKDGQAYPAQPITLEPTEVRHVNLDNIRPFALRGRNPSGGLTLNYNGAMMEVVAQITSFGQGQAGSVDIPFSAAMDYQSTIQEAVWWSPQQSTATIILGNATDTAITATLQFPSGEAATYALAPYATEIVTRQRNGNQIADVDSVKVTSTGAVGSLRVTGAIQTNNNRYTSTIRFYDPQATKQQNLYATNFRLKGNAPHLVLKNIGDAPLTATPRFLSPAGAADNPVQFAPVTLAPSETKEVDLTQLVNAAVARPELETVTVQVLSSGAKGNLIGALTAYNDAARMSFDAPLRDSGPTRNATGGYPWQISGNYSALVSITNVGETPAKFVAYMNFAGGKWNAAIQQLSAGETAFFDLKKIRDQQTKDKDGRVIPRNITNGQFHWSRYQGDDNLKLIGRLEMVSATTPISNFTAEATREAESSLQRRRRTNRNVSSSFSCGVCCPDSGPFPYMQASSLGVLVNDFRSVDSMGDLYTCYGGTSYTGGIYSHNWAVTDPYISLAVTEGYSNNVSGVSPGFANHYAIAETYYVWEEGAGDCYRSTYEDPEIVGDVQTIKIMWTPSGGLGIPLAQGTDSSFVDSTTFSATADPTGGTWMWSTTSNKVSLMNSTSATVTVKSVMQSGAAGDVVIKLAYTYNGNTIEVPESQSPKCTVQKPTSFALYSTTTNQAHTGCPSGKAGWDKSMSWQLKDHLGGDIQRSIPCWDTMDNNTPNSCNIPAQGEGTPPGPTTNGNGIWNHRYEICSSACVNGGSCQVTGNQNYTVNGYSISLSYTMTCNSITVAGQ